MSFGKRRLLTAFLEKDNLKLLSYEVAGKKLTRVFGGQISFGADVLKEAFIADPIKFSSQVRLVLSQKSETFTVSDVVLFIAPEKTFLKALPASDSVESFIRSMPYFKEELLIDTGPSFAKATAGEDSGQLVNHVAFEKKLVEDLERPFLESGKKVASFASGLVVLTRQFAQTGKYLLLVQFEKDTVVAAMDGEIILDFTTFAKDVFAGRINEFRLGKNFGDIKAAFTLGVFEAGVLEKVRTDTGLTVTELGTNDVYDLAVTAFISQAGKSVGAGAGILKLPGQKWLFLIGAAVVGFVLVIAVVKGLGGLSLPKIDSKQKTATVEKIKKTTPKPAPPAAPVVKPADFKVRVLNGTKVTGEAGRAADSLKTLGFNIDSTGNASTSGFVATRLRVANDVPQVIVDQIKNVLLQTYESVALEPFKDEAVKIEVIVGIKK